MSPRLVSRLSWVLVLLGLALASGACTNQSSQGSASGGRAGSDASANAGKSTAGGRGGQRATSAGNDSGSASESSGGSDSGGGSLGDRGDGGHGGLGPSLAAGGTPGDAGNAPRENGGAQPDDGGTSGSDGGGAGTPATSERSRDGLLVLYTFDGNGNQLSDSSGVEPPLDLNMYGEGLTRIKSGIKFAGVGDPIAVSSGGASKVIAGVKASGEITVELWLKSTAPCQAGPARLFSLAKMNHHRNLSVLNGPAACGDHGGGDIFQVRLKNKGEDNGCEPIVFENALKLPLAETAGCNQVAMSDLSVTVNAIQHIVLTQDKQGVQTFYNNGASSTVDQDEEKSFEHWYDDTPLGLGNEPNDGQDATNRDSGRQWLGEMYLVAIYRRALTASEVSAHFRAGHEAN